MTCTGTAPGLRPRWEIRILAFRRNDIVFCPWVQSVSKIWEDDYCHPRCTAGNFKPGPGAREGRPQSTDFKTVDHFAHSRVHNDPLSRPARRHYCASIARLALLLTRPPAVGSPGSAPAPWPSPAPRRWRAPSRRRPSGTRRRRAASRAGGGRRRPQPLPCRPSWRDGRRCHRILKGARLLVASVSAWMARSDEAQ
jgi:hypothetical protein